MHDFFPVLIYHKEMTLRIVNRVLLSLVGLLVFLIIIGTIYAFVRPVPIETIPAISQAQDDIRIFDRIGRLRIPLQNSSIMVLSVVFPYSADDTAFTEELNSRIGDFRSIAVNYFAAISPEELAAFNEEKAKAEILGYYNAILRLGRIKAIYFSDLIVIN